MKNKTILFLILTVVTGLVGFSLSFAGVEVIRILFLIFADLLIISVLARFFFSDSRKMRLQSVKK